MEGSFSSERAQAIVDEAIEKLKSTDVFMSFICWEGLSQKLIETLTELAKDRQNCEIALKVFKEFRKENFPL